MDGRLFGPYEAIGVVSIIDSGKFAFDYAKEGKHLYNFCGKEVTKRKYYDLSWDEIWRKKRWGSYFQDATRKVIYEVRSEDDKHVFYSDMDYDYVLIDEKVVGEHPAADAYYDERKHAFIWNCIEGKELVVYEYKLD
jgi:hypothetical protein